jgi:DNA-binding LytR/AlgR family response regulator
MINCLVIDDEQHAIDLIEDYIREIPYLKLVCTTTNPVEGLSIVNKGGVDIVFLDIQMPYLLGPDFVKACNGKCKIIFTTAHEKYALESFEMDIIDYLLKPISFPRFLKAVQKAQTIIELVSPYKKQLENAHENYIFLRGIIKGSYIKVELMDIDYVKATGNYVCVVCGTKKIIAHTKMCSIEGLLPDKQFVRVKKSFIVNTSKIFSITGNSIKLKNSNADILIGSTYKTAFLEILRARLADK